jgi:hypothetical protein
VKKAVNSISRAGVRVKILRNSRHANLGRNQELQNSRIGSSIVANLCSLITPETP